VRSDYRKIENAAATQIVQYVEDFRIAIARRLATVNWQISNLNEIKRIIGRYADDLKDNAIKDLTTRQQKAFTRGIKQVDDVLLAKGVVPYLPYIPMKSLTDSQALAAQLIQGLSSNMAQRVNTEITLGLMGEVSPYEVMQRLSNFIPPLKDAGNQTATAFGRAETIARTEMNRVNCMANKDRLLQVKEKYKDAKKKWKATHKINSRPEHQAQEELGPMPMDYEFDVNGTLCFGPLDAVLPVGEVANCGCTLQLIL
jgi:hypothetical protein